MKVVVLHQAVSDDAAPDESDVLDQVEAVATALASLGHEAVPLPFHRDLARVRRDLRRLAPGCVVNLVESVDGQGRLIELAPALLDALSLPYTGARTSALRSTSDKLRAKRVLHGAGLPSPPWWAPGDPGDPPRTGCYIVKSVWEDASLGLDDRSVVDAARTDLRRAVHRRAPRLGGEAFAERYVAGREFNLSLLAKSSGVEVLPPAEIRFDGFPDGKPHIVGYAAKWEPASFEHAHTPRRFEFGPGDRALLECLRHLALAAWRAFGLRGYARVDFRVDRSDQPWILEVNANPCLSPDAGFLAATHRANLAPAEVVARILQDARDAAGAVAP
jgi:D-alanine-D-alanine ligase